MLIMSDEPDSYWDDYESGPFCVHWSELGDCADSCERCGHSCNEHEGEREVECRFTDCTCQGFVDQPVKTCERCGHSCNEHEVECRFTDCTCQGFVDQPVKTEQKP